MSLGRRKVSVADPSRWVFNKMADVYDARPAYPEALVEEIAALARAAGGAVGDVGAGIGHLALPLAARGFDVVAVEPAAEMLARLRRAAVAHRLPVSTVHASAESLPLSARSLGLVVLADVLHFVDRELAAHEIGRVLARYGALAIVTCGLGDTPFMRALVGVMEEAVPRRPRDVGRSFAQISTIANVPLQHERRFHDEVAVDRPTLDRILRSISFIGPAMNPARFAAFRQRVHALPGPAVWARTFTLRFGQRLPSSRVRAEAARRSAVSGSAG